MHCIYAPLMCFCVHHGRPFSNELPSGLVSRPHVLLFCIGPSSRAKEIDLGVPSLGRRDNWPTFSKAHEVNDKRTYEHLSSCVVFGAVSYWSIVPSSRQCPTVAVEMFYSI